MGNEQVSTVNFYNLICNAIQKITVMCYHDNRTPIFFQLVFQELYGFIVNVVGWFV